MSKITFEPPALEKLKGLIQPVDVCDASGQIVGRFFPKLDPAQFNLEPQISEEELQRRMQSQEKTYTTAEVIAHLEKL